MDELNPLLTLRKHYDDRINNLNSFFATLLSIMVGSIPLMEQAFTNHFRLRQFFVYAALFTIYINFVWIYAITQCLNNLKTINKSLIACAIDYNAYHLQAQFQESKYYLILRQELSLPIGFMVVSGAFALFF